MLFFCISCNNEQECKDAKRIGGVKKDVICASLFIMTNNLRTDDFGRGTLTTEQVSRNSFANDLKLLIIGNCIHPSRPTDNRCNNKISFGSGKKRNSDDSDNRESK